MRNSGSGYNPIVIPNDEDLDLDSLELIPGRVATVTDPALALSRNLPAPVLYCQPMHLLIYARVRLDLILRQLDFALLLLILWFFFTDQLLVPDPCPNLHDNRPHPGSPSWVLAYSGI